MVRAMFSARRNFAAALQVANPLSEASNCEHHAILSKAHHLYKLGI
jgi:hypothetical protein